MTQKFFILQHKSHAFYKEILRNKYKAKRRAIIQCLNEMNEAVCSKILVA